MIKKLFISLKSIGFKKTIVKLIFRILDYLSYKSYKRKKFEKSKILKYFKDNYGAVKKILNKI